MMFHSRFVFLTLLGQQVGWGTQARSDQGTGWLEALRFHGRELVLGVLWGAVMYLINPSFFWWLTPILIALIFSIPLTVYTSRADVGRRLRRSGLFLIPEEIEPPPELASLRSASGRLRPPFAPGHRPQAGFRLAVVDPATHALHLSLLGAKGKLSPPSPSAAGNSGKRRWPKARTA